MLHWEREKGHRPQAEHMRAVPQRSELEQGKHWGGEDPGDGCYSRVNGTRHAPYVRIKTVYICHMQRTGR